MKPAITLCVIALVGCASPDKVGTDFGEADSGTDMSHDSGSLCDRLQDEFEELTTPSYSCDLSEDCVLVPGRTEDRPEARRAWPDRAFELRDQGLDERCEYFQGITNNGVGVPPGFQAECVENQCTAVEES